MLTHVPVLRRLAREEHGFTLMETLVAMLTGLIVIGALYAILEVSLHQSARVVDVVQATQLGRTTMTRMVDKLHSACLAPSFKPIQEKSTENELIFRNAYSNKAIIPTASENASEGAYEHKIKYEKNFLVDYAYPSTGGSYPEFTYSKTATPAKGTRLGENISQSESGGKPVPIFQYFGYASESHSSPTEPLGSISTTPFKATTASPLSEANADETASILISFRAAAADNDTRQNRSIDLSNQVTLAFSAPNSEATIEAGPCE
jgi:Tfp pilus assembly protein PilW